MRKLIFSFAILALAVAACQDNADEVSPNQEISVVDMSDFYLYTDDDLSAKAEKGSSGDKCYTMKVLNRQLKENPDLYQKMYNIELHTRQFIAGKKPSGTPGGGPPGNNDDDSPPDPEPYNGTVTIPVYVQVVYSNSDENISRSQVQSQITILNDDFIAANGDAGDGALPEFALPANIEVQFSLDENDIEWYFNSKTSWGTNNDVKYTYPPKSGYLNIWVCNIGGNIIGYAQFPGGNTATDGVVIGPQYFGSSVLTNGYFYDPYDKGRTATHEIGHWLNLRHIWGDGRCRQDDFVSDTPTSDRPNYGCPGTPYHCRSYDMSMNYMDYTYDACMNMFTPGQKDRMRALFASGGARESIVNQTSL